jgi:hypothetical protein
MKNKDFTIQFSGQLQSVAIELSKRLEKRGFTLTEAIAKLSQPASEKILDEIVNLIVPTKLRTLKHLELLKSNIQISTRSFSKQKFLNSRLGVKICMEKNFENWIISELSEEIPAFSANLTSYKPINHLYDREIRADIGEDDVRTPDEALAIIFGNILKQPNGEFGGFQNTGGNNIQYICLKSGDIISLPVRWHSGDHLWVLTACPLGVDEYYGSARVFARSLPV